jgi:hypothetical protein
MFSQSSGALMANVRRAEKADVELTMADVLPLAAADSTGAAAAAMAAAWEAERAAAAAVGKPPTCGLTAG